MLFRKLVHSAFDIGFAYLDDLPSQRHQILERIRNEREQKHNYLPIILIKSFPDRRTIENSDLCANSPKKL